MTKDRERSWGDTRRVDVGKQHRAITHSTPIVTEEAAPGAFPVEIHDEITKPTDLLLALAQAAPEHPVTVADFIQLWGRVSDVKVAQHTEARTRADQIMEVAAAPATQRLNQLELRVRIMWFVLVAAVTMAGGSVISVAKGLYAKGGEDVAAEMRLKGVEDLVKDHEARMRIVELNDYLIRHMPTPTLK